MESLPSLSVTTTGFFSMPGRPETHQDSISLATRDGLRFELIFFSQQFEDTVKRTLEMINQMQADGVISKYAIGGAVGATFYLEPSATLDVDVFVSLPVTPGSSLLSLTPIYEYLQARGSRVEAEYIVIGDWPVQFLPPSDALERDGIEEALQTEVEGVKTWVMRAEHLVAIALRTGRAKDHARILQFLEQGAVDRRNLDQVLAQCNLADRWELFERKYLKETNE